MNAVVIATAIILVLTNAAGGFSQQSLVPPFRFEVNQGQASRDVKYVAVGSAYKAELTDTGVIVPLEHTRLAVRFKGGNPQSIEALDDLNLITNYYSANDVPHTGIRNYGRVRYRSVYPGIDVVFYGTGNKLEFDFIISPGANTNAIVLAVSGHDNLRATGKDVILKAPDSEVTLSVPRLYQETSEGRKAVKGRFILAGPDEIGFAVDGYDHSKLLVIDPTLAFSTYTSIRSTEFPSGIGYDDAGNIYVTFVGDATCCNMSLRVQKISRDGSSGYITDFGFYSNWSARDLAVDSGHNVYVVGGLGVVQPDSAGPLPTKNAIYAKTPAAGSFAGFVFKLNPGGEVLFSTYTGGPDSDDAKSIAIDPLQTNVSILLNSGEKTFIKKMAADGSAIISSTVVDDGKLNKLALDSSGNIYAGARVAGSTGDGLIKLNPGGSVLWRWPNTVTDFALDKSGTVFVLRVTGSFSAAFVDKIDTDGHFVTSSNALPALQEDIAVGSDGNVYLAGSTYATTGSSPVPVINSFRQQPRVEDVLVLKLSADLKNYLYSTFLNGSIYEGPNGPASGGNSRGYVIQLDPAGRAYVAGTTTALDFPTTDGSTRTNSGGFDFYPVAFVLDPSVTDATPRYTRLEEDYFAIQYAGSWYGNTSSLDSGGKAVLAMDTGSTASLSFTGNGEVRWFGCRDGWTGIAKVSVNGAVQAMVDTYSPTTQCNTQLWSTSLSSGAHTITIEVSGTKNPSSQGFWIWVDKFEITSAGDIEIDTTPASGSTGGGGGGSTGGGSTTFTRVEQNNSAVTYNGTWYTNTGSSKSGGSAVLALDNGARATFTFSGTAAKWIGFEDAWSGIANVYVDGVLKTQIDTYAPTDQAQVVLYTISGLSSATHTLAVEVSGTKNPSSQSYWIWADAFEFASDSTTGGGTPGGGTSGSATFTRVEQNNSAVSYTGSWYANSGSFNSGGSAVLALDKGSRATFTFTGTDAKWIGYKDAWSGIANVYVDGALKTQIDTYSATDQAQAVLYTISGLSSGTHTLAIEVSGTKNPASQSYWIWADAFDYASGTSTTTGSTRTYMRVEQNSPAVTYTESWYSNSGSFNSGGSAVLALDSGARATFTFTGTAAKWIGYRDAWSGVANVYIDGSLKTQVDTYSANDQAKAVNYTITGLSSGADTITIEVTGTKGGAAQSAWVWVDAFDYLP